MAGDTQLTTLRVLTFLTAIAVGLSPFPEIYQVYKQRAVGDVSILPIVTLFANSYLWHGLYATHGMIYSYLVGNFFPLFAVTAFAAATSIVFSTLYIWWSTEPRTTRRFYSLWGGFAVLLATITVYVAIGIAGLTRQSRHQVVSVLGYCCVVMNLCLKIAPLETIKRIVRTKNASSMPVMMSIVAFVNGILWVWTCILTNNMYILTPNAAGAALGGVQAIVYIIYWPDRAEAAIQSSSISDSDVGRSRRPRSNYELCSCSDKEQTRSSAFVELRSPA